MGAKKLMIPATLKITEVISTNGGFGFPGENFIPQRDYTRSGGICKSANLIMNSISDKMDGKTDKTELITTNNKIRLSVIVINQKKIIISDFK